MQTAPTTPEGRPPAAPPGFVWLDNFGDPALVPIALMGPVYVDRNGTKSTRIPMLGLTSPEGGSLTLHVRDTPAEVAAAIAAALGGAA